MAQAKKTPPVEEAEIVAAPKRYKGWDMSRIFWGLLLVIIGVLALLDNFGVVEVKYGNLWQLWPLLVVGWGVSLLNIKGSWWSVVSLLLMIGSLGLLVWAAIGTVPFRDVKSSHQTRQIEKTSNLVKRLDVSVDAGAGKLTIGAHDANLPVKATLESDITTLNMDSRRDSNTQKVNVSTEGRRKWMFGNFQNDLAIELTKQLPVDLKVKTGASDLEADLASILLEHLDLDLGANSTEVTLGDKVDAVEVTLDAGASSVTLRVPKQSGVSVKLDKGISSQNLAGLKDEGNGLYQTADFASATKKITIRGDIGVTSFSLERY